MLNRRIKKIAIFSVFLYVFLIKTGYTDADIFAERTVGQNKFSVITLDFSTMNSFNNNSITNLFSSFGIQPHGFDLGAIRIKRRSESDFKYYLQTVKINGDDEFCNSLKLDVLDKYFIKKFSGYVMDLSMYSKINDDDPGDWIFVLSMDDEDQELKNKMCEFNFDFKTYRNNPDETGGLFAQKLIRNTVSSGNW